MKDWLPILAFQAAFLFLFFVISLIHTNYGFDTRHKTDQTINVGNSSIENNTIQYKDLLAQQRMAQEAAEMSDLTSTQNLISKIGLGFVFLTTLFAGLAWRASARAASATENTNIVQNRAYLKIESLDISQYERGATIFYKIKNFGNTPANNVQSHYCFVSFKQLHLGGSKKAIDFIENHFSERRLSSSPIGSIPPSDEHKETLGSNHPMAIVDYEEEDHTNDGKMFVACILKVTYDDVFSNTEKRETKAAAFYALDSTNRVKQNDLMV